MDETVTKKKIKRARIWKWYYVVNYIDKPLADIDEFVTVPRSWIVSCVNEKQGFVGYPPVEPPGLTRARIKKKLKPEEGWRYYLANIKYGSNTYKEAEDWIVERQTYGVAVEERSPAPNVQLSEWGRWTKSRRKPFPKIHIRLSEPKSYIRNQLKLKKIGSKFSTHVNKTAQPGCSKSNQSVNIQNKESKDIAKSSHGDSLSSQSEENQQQSSSTEEELDINMPSENEVGVEPVKSKEGPSQITIKQQPRSLQAMSTKNHMNVSQPIIRLEKLVEKPINQMTPTDNMSVVPQDPSNLKIPTRKLAEEGQLSIVAQNQSQVVSRDPKMNNKASVESGIDLNTRKYVSVHDQPNSTQHQSSTNQPPVRLLDRQQNLPAQNAYLQHAIPDQIYQRFSGSHNTGQRYGSKELPASIVHSQTHPEIIPPGYNWRFYQNQYQPTNYNSFSQDSFSSTNMANNYSYQHNDQAIRMGINANVPNMLQKVLLQNKQSQQNHQQPQQVPTSQTTSHPPTSVPPKDLGRQLSFAHNNYAHKEQKLQATFNQSVPNLENSYVTANAGLTDQCMIGEFMSPHFGDVSRSNAVIEHQVSAGPEMAVKETSGETMTASYGSGIPTGSNPAVRAEDNTTIDECRRQSDEQQILNQYASSFHSLYNFYHDAGKMYEVLGRSFHQATEELQKLIDSIQNFNRQYNADEFETPDGHTTDDLPAEVPSREVTTNENQHTNNPLNEVLTKKPNLPVLPPEYDPNDTKWTLRHKDSKQGLVELMPETGILVNHKELLYRVNQSKDCKSLAQLLLPVVFNKNALGVCSTYVEKILGINVGFARPELDENAMNVLLNYVLDHGQRNGSTAELKSILQAVHNTIQEFRFEYSIATQNKNQLNLKQ